MCGIFGVISKEGSKFKVDLIKNCVDNLFLLSESRGKEAAGFALKINDKIFVYKKPTAASAMVNSPEYKNLLADIVSKNSSLDKQKVLNNPLAIIGHSRLVTNGRQTLSTNNQPVIKDGLVGIHNGIIVNVDQLWQKFQEIQRQYEVDTEVLLSLITYFRKQGQSITKSLQKTFSTIEGAASVAILLNDNPYLILATNTGSLYTCLNENNDLLAFASERYILKQLVKNCKEKDLFKADKILHVLPGTGYLINTKNLEIQKFELHETAQPAQENKTEKNQIEIIDVSPENKLAQTAIEANNAIPTNLVQYEPDLGLKRCTKCILPETFPGISFDEQGVCNLCRNHQKKQAIGQVELEKILKEYRSDSDRPDCLVAFSGGRDSSYGLHLIKKELKMNPLAFTYDWGMVTDLARRNQARICGKLGIEHILVSADIKKKRENIKKNVSAWLKKPNLGTVPLFMAGDKQFFYYANKLMKQNNIRIMLFCENEKLENTKFKTGFCGVHEGNHRWANMPTWQKIKLATYYGKQFAKNPAYLNSSLFDTAFAYLSTYFIAHNYIFLYRYIDWDETIINSTLINGYNWETATDTKSTWRIGDGTAPFYNYIYYTIAGFTENDTFRSNQIREGLISREEALKYVRTENQPRPESLKWYADQIGLVLEQAIKKINSVPKLYKK